MRIIPGAARPVRGTRLAGLVAAALAALSIAALVALPSTSTPSAGAVAPPMSFSVSPSSVSAGSSFNLNGTGCGTASQAQVLITLQSPLGDTVVSTVASVPPSGGQWNASLRVPPTVLPSASYVLHASCRLPGTATNYAPVTVAVTSAGSRLTLSTSSVASGGSLVVSGAGCTPGGGPTSAVASLVDDQANPIDVAAVAPAANGTWSASLTAPANAYSGIYLVEATCDQYSAGTNYAPQSIAVQSVTPESTGLGWRGATSGFSGNAVTLAAVLTANGLPVAGVPVVLMLGANSVTATTNTGGVARGVVIAPGAGATTYSASFAGNNGFSAASIAAHAFTVNPALAPTKLLWSAPSTAREFSPASLSAKLLSTTNLPIVGRSVTFTLPSGTAEAAITNSSGVASISEPFTTTGAVSVGVAYDGDSDSTYASSKTTHSVIVSPPFVPAGVACATTTTCFIVGNSGGLEKSASSDTAWTWVVSPTTANLSSIACPSVTVCVAVGANGTVIRTSNAGVSWTSVSSGTPQNLSVVKCGSATSCVAVGSAGTALESSDSGATWSPGTSGTTLNFEALSCPSATFCLASASNSGGSGQSVTLTSVNAGSTWSLAVTGFPFGQVTNQGQLFCTSATVCLAGSFEQVYRTTDGGHTWKAGSSSFYSLALWCTSTTRCLVLDGSLFIDVSISTDGGVTFPTTHFVGESNGYPQDLTCLSNRCIGIFNPGYPADATAFTSADSGATWIGPAPL